MDLMLPFLGMLLDLADSVAAAVALVAFWRTWLFPRPDPRRPAMSKPAPTLDGGGVGELERFLNAARAYGRVQTR